MPSNLWTIDPEAPDAALLARAAERIRAGELVAFPTETVYGLGANALDAAACGKIFTAKGRPSSNPLIVHILNATDAVLLAKHWPGPAMKLAEAFWPGPLTIVVEKADHVPVIVTAGGDTVAVRSPDHAVARGLLKACGLPLAAPSANRSQQLSPTLAEHVYKNFGDQITILDAGPCRGGLESTVVDATGECVRLLRHGLVTVPMLESVVGEVLIGASQGIARSPGLMAKHYSPRTKLILAENLQAAEAILDSMKAKGMKAAVRGPAADPKTEAAKLYADLHRLDSQNLDYIIAVKPPDTADWAAVNDRLTRATGESF